MTSTNETFQAVLSDFKKRLTSKELQDFEFTTLQDVRETANRIQNEQEQSKTMMNMARLESFLEAMEQFEKVINVFVNASSFVAFVWGPMKLILQVMYPFSYNSFAAKTINDSEGEMGSCERKLALRILSLALHMKS